ncbi:MAG TPA: hypothetical protein VGO60_05770, partial [Iamia sp.]|nr:hypothetical protein [Iamia sp.]
TGDRLLVGWTGAHLLLLDVTSGAVVSAVDLDGTGGRGAVAIGRDAIAIAEAGGLITVYGYAEGLGDSLWSTDAYPDSTGLAAVDGGLVVLDPTGIHGLRPA